MSSTCSTTALAADTASSADERSALFDHVLRLGDSSLLLGHRLSEWIAKGPTIEEDIALANVGLDLIGHARSLLSYAGEVEARGRSEDDLAYLRDAGDWRNVLLVELPNGDFADTIVRQFLVDAYHVELYTALSERSADQCLADIAAKAVKEVRYHCRHSSGWMIRLGDGTEYSHGRVQQALDDLWPYTGELFAMTDADLLLMTSGAAVDLTRLQDGWERIVGDVLAEATLTRPEDGWMQTGGTRGIHTEHLGYLLAELQFLPRAYPGSQW